MVVELSYSVMFVDVVLYSVRVQAEKTRVDLSKRSSQLEIRKSLFCTLLRHSLTTNIACLNISNCDSTSEASQHPKVNHLL